MDDAEDTNEKNGKAQCRLAPATFIYLDRLVKTGTFGTNRSDVMKFLIMQGIQQAIKEGMIKIID